MVERPRGLGGEFKALPLTDFPQRFDPGARIFIAQQPRTVQRALWHKGRVYLRCRGVDSREAAEALRGELIEVPAGERPPGARPDDGFWYLDEIEGLQVRTADGDELGAVREVLQTGANDVYVVARDDRPDLLIPALKDVIRSIDLDAAQITVDLPDGLDPAIT